MIKLENYTRIKVKLVKCHNEDPMAVNGKCICQNVKNGILVNSQLRFCLI